MWRERESTRKDFVERISVDYSVGKLTEVEILFHFSFPSRAATEECSQIIIMLKMSQKLMMRIFSKLPFLFNCNILF